jgi:hypothetical protein
MEKMTHFGPMSFNKHANGLKYRALGIIAQGGQVYGFQETCFMHTSALGSVLGMYVTNAWPTVDAPMPSSTFFGGILTCVDGDTIYGNNAWKKEARNERSLKNLGWHLAESSMVMKLGRDIFRQAGYKETVAMPFTKYSVKPKPGSYLDKLIKEGKVEFISQEQIKERKQKR